MLTDGGRLGLRRATSGTPPSRLISIQIQIQVQAYLRHAQVKVIDRLHLTLARFEWLPTNTNWSSTIFYHLNGRKIWISLEELNMRAGGRSNSLRVGTNGLSIAQLHKQKREEKTNQNFSRLPRHKWLLFMIKMFAPALFECGCCCCCCCYCCCFRHYWRSTTEPFGPRLRFFVLELENHSSNLRQPSHCTIKVRKRDAIIETVLITTDKRAWPRWL